MTNNPEPDEKLVERLRNWADQGDFGRGPNPDDLRRIAADRIEQLSAEIARANEIIRGKTFTVDPRDARIAGLEEELASAKACLGSMACTAFSIGLEGTKDWDLIAGEADLHGQVRRIEAMLSEPRP